PTGIASFDLLKMAREGLMVELRTAINLAKSSNSLVRRQATRLDPGGRTQPVEIQAIPLRPATPGPRYFLVLFEEARPQPVPQEVPAGADKPESDNGQRQLSELRREIDATREYLQSIIEENEATTEELKSANEEILSSNEELQSTNEELQTAKE